MYEFSFKGFNKEQCDKYLERIHAEYDGNPTLENLNYLIHKHQIAVPFENLALKMGYGTVSLDSKALFEKIVVNKRGGFCFELNGAFCLLLKGLGYDAFGVMARVGVPVLGTLDDLFHRGIMVRIDGKKMYCDVGFGGPKANFAIEMNGEKQNKGKRAFWIEDTDEGWKMVCSKGTDDGGPEDGAVIVFAPIAMLPSDFVANCEKLKAAGDTIFHMNRILNICLEDGYIDIRNNSLKICRGDFVEEREFEEAEFPVLAEEYFGIKMN